MNKDKLFTASLSEEDSKIETYDITKFFYVAFFGGIIPLIGLGTQAAKQFKVEKKLIAAFAAVGVLVLLAKYIFLFAIFKGQIPMEINTLKMLSRAAAVVLYFAYYIVMKERFVIHVSYGGKIKPLLWNAVAWIAAATLVEGGILALVTWGAGVF